MTYTDENMRYIHHQKNAQYYLRHIFCSFSNILSPTLYR
jgi:hypothetical protein